MKKIVLMVLVLIFAQMLFAQDAFAAKQAEVQKIKYLYLEY